MKRIRGRFVFFLVWGLLLLPVDGVLAYARSLILTPGGVVRLLVGEEGVIRMGPMAEEGVSVTCVVQGKAVTQVAKEKVSCREIVFRFRAVEPGEALILEKISKNGKKGLWERIRRFHVRVYTPEGVSPIPLNLIAAHPDRYAGKFVLVSGICRGWGFPSKAKALWGAMVTRSDWIIEDATGAAYVTGLLQVKKGRTVRVICQVITRPGGTWTLFGRRILTSAPKDRGVEAVVRGNNTFALKLFYRLTRAKGKAGRNIFFSPFSISDALAMTYAGARGETARQMAEVLRFTLPQKAFHAAFSALIRKIRAGVKGGSCTLRIANALWGQKGYGFLPGFVRLVDRDYGGGFFTVDFAGRTEETRVRINRWVEKQTENKIRNLIQKGDITALTRLVLTNAIYFKGSWASPFEKKATEPRPFHPVPGKGVSVPMMYQRGSFPYAEEGAFKVLELPYAGGELSMLILLPDAPSTLGGLERTLTAKKIRDLRKSLRKREVAVYLPRFKLKMKVYLSRILAGMGMPDAFSNRADFTGISGNRELEISKVIHQAYVDVNERGTEAAAATAVAIRLKAVMRAWIFKADHPFIFIILHRGTGSILFMGEVRNPQPAKKA